MAVLGPRANAEDPREEVAVWLALKIKSYEKKDVLGTARNEGAFSGTSEG